MSQNNQNYQKILSAQEKANAALEAACAMQPIEQIAQKYGVYPDQIEEWKQKLIEKSSQLFADNIHFDCLQAPCNDSIFRPKQPQFQPLAIPPINLEKMQIKQITQDHQKHQINNVLIFKNFAQKHTKKTIPQFPQLSQFLLTTNQEDIKEKERKRIAREIHDDLGQNLLAMRLDMLMLHQRTARTHPRLHEIVNIVLNNVDTTIRSVKSIVNDLRPLELDLGLQAAIEWLLKTFERISGAHCLLHMHETTCAKFPQTLNNEQTLAIFRILQEALSNIIRHSFATEVEVAINQNESVFAMTVKDNGIGMPHQNEGKNNSFGIIGIKERLHSINGECVIESKRGAGTCTGTTLHITIPIGEQSSKTQH